LSRLRSTVLAVTPGEPAGIGPDIVLSSYPVAGTSLLVVASPDLLADRAAELKIHVPINDFSATGTLVADRLNVLPVATRVRPKSGELDPRNGNYVIETLEQAVRLCESGTCAGMVTGPVNKAVINDSGLAFSGHTEWLQQRTGSQHVVMMLATEGLKVALATTHLPLRRVADAITPTLLEQTIRTLHHDLQRRFGISQPRILVLGLNPHAGESGHLGREELDIIIPVITALTAAGFRMMGPLPADTAFTPHVLQTCDVVLAMYHDQGLPVLKWKGFGRAANITLGLPIIRTSVDHGTAVDIAGTGRADPSSFLTAIAYAQLMSEQTGSSA
jgi:4-hydroxythreonine-4-phosphate dehydrogenase